MTPARAATAPIIARTAATSSGKSAPAISAAATPTARSAPRNSPQAARNDQVKMVELKLSQGAKPGHGGVLPGAKVTRGDRRRPAACRSASTASRRRGHSAFSTPIEMMQFIAKMRRLSGGKPAGFKLCIGHPWEFLAICKAMLETGIYPDFIVVDGKEGGTGAAPLEFTDHLGMPLREGLNFVHNALIGINARDRIKIGASGKIISAFDIARAMALGADWCNSARGFMFALGCIQSQSCHTDRCPTGVVDAGPRRASARSWCPTRPSASTISIAPPSSRSPNWSAAAGLDHPTEFTPAHFSRRVSAHEVKSFAELYPPLKPGELLAGTARPALRQRLGHGERQRISCAANGRLIGSPAISRPASK